MSSNTGTTTVDFGAFPGTNSQTVTITGQTAIQSTSKVEAFFMLDALADKTANDHAFVALLAKPTCGNIVVSTGFDIEVVSTQALQGAFTLRWVWAD